MCNHSLTLAEQIPNLWNVMAPALLLAVEVYSQRTCTSRQVGSHKIVGTCGTHISDTMKDGHPTLFAEGPEGSLLPLVPVKDVCASNKLGNYKKHSRVIFSFCITVDATSCQEHV